MIPGAQWALLAALMAVITVALAGLQGARVPVEVLWDAPQGPGSSAAAQAWWRQQASDQGTCSPPDWDDSMPTRAYRVRMPFNTHNRADNARDPSPDRWVLGLSDSIAERVGLWVGAACPPEIASAGSVAAAAPAARAAWAAQGRLEPFDRRAILSPNPNWAISGVPPGAELVVWIQDRRAFRPWITIRPYAEHQRQIIGVWMLITTLGVVLTTLVLVGLGMRRTHDRWAMTGLVCFAVALMAWLLHHFNIGPMLLPEVPWHQGFKALHPAVLIMVLIGLGAGAWTVLGPQGRSRRLSLSMLAVALAGVALSPWWTWALRIGTLTLAGLGVLVILMSLHAMRTADGARRLLLLGLCAAMMGGIAQVLSALVGGELIGPLAAYGFVAGAWIHALLWLGAIVQSERSMEQEQRERLVHEATYDAVTGLLNRQHIQAEMAQTIVAFRPASAVISVTIERLKTINGTLGHAAGDELLKVLAQRMQGTSRAWATAHPGWTVELSRFSGALFLIWAHHPLVREIQRPPCIDELVEGLIDALSARLNARGRWVSVTPRAGVLWSPADDPGPTQMPPSQWVDQLIGDADAALQVARRRGGQNWVPFEVSMRETAELRLALESEMLAAIRNGHLELHYQPILRLSDGAHAGMEALVRWRHPERGLISPALFIPLAEENGAVIELGRWVIEQTCRDIGLWRTQGLWREGWYASFNLSLRQLDDPDLLTVIDASVRRHGVKVQDLRVELTESTVIERRDQAAGLFDALARRGYRLCMDDFGTGYSSLSSLGTLPFSVLKLDKSFLDSLMRDTNQQTLVAGVLALADKMQLSVVAEGVTEIEQAHWLQAAGCGWAQGYLYSRPLDASGIRAWLDGERLRETDPAVDAIPGPSL